MKFRRSRNRRPSTPQTPQVSKNHSYDSSGPTGKIRGTAQQLYERYTALARDVGTGLNADRVLAESYFQFAEHYYRILLEIRRQETAHLEAHYRSAPPSMDSDDDADADEDDEAEGEDKPQRPEARPQNNEPAQDRPSSARSARPRQAPREAKPSLSSEQPSEAPSHAEAHHTQVDLSTAEQPATDALPDFLRSTPRPSVEVSYVSPPKRRARVSTPPIPATDAPSPDIQVLGEDNMTTAEV